MLAELMAKLPELMSFTDDGKRESLRDFANALARIAMAETFNQPESPLGKELGNAVRFLASGAADNELRTMGLGMVDMLLVKQMLSTLSEQIPHGDTSKEVS